MKKEKETLEDRKEGRYSMHKDEIGKKDEKTRQKRSKGNKDKNKI